MNDFLFAVNKLQILKAKTRVEKLKLNVRTVNNNKINITTVQLSWKKHTQLLNTTFEIKL